MLGLLPGAPFGKVLIFSEFRKYENEVYFKLRMKGKGAGKGTSLLGAAAKEIEQELHCVDFQVIAVAIGDSM